MYLDDRFFDDRFLEYLYVTGQLNTCIAFNDKIRTTFFVYDADDFEDDYCPCTDTYYEDRTSKKEELQSKRRIYKKNEQ